MPVLACQAYGRGRTFAMTTDTTVEWGKDFERFWGENDNRYFRKFWRNVVQWLGENSRKGPAACASKPTNRSIVRISRSASRCGPTTRSWRIRASTA